MNTQQVLDAIDDACGQHDGSELELMQALVDKAQSWRMRADELESEEGEDDDR